VRDRRHRRRRVDRQTEQDVFGERGAADDAPPVPEFDEVGELPVLRQPPGDLRPGRENAVDEIAASISSALATPAAERSSQGERKSNGVEPVAAASVLRRRISSGDSGGGPSGR